jgi:hypothetical protein
MELLPPPAAIAGVEVGVTVSVAFALLLVYILLLCYSDDTAVSVRADPTYQDISTYPVTDALIVNVTVTVYSASVPKLVVNFFPVVPSTPELKATVVPFILTVKLSTAVSKFFIAVSTSEILLYKNK